MGSERRENTVPVAIREAMEADRERIAGLLSAIQLSADGILTAGSRYWLAEDERAQAIGVIGLEYGSGAALLRSAGVLPEWRGAGIGAALVATALAAAQADGCRHVYLFSTGAGLYWQRYGFDEVPVDELVQALPESFQVRHYETLGWLPTEIAWRRRLYGTTD